MKNVGQCQSPCHGKSFGAGQVGGAQRRGDRKPRLNDKVSHGELEVKLN